MQILSDIQFQYIPCHNEFDLGAAVVQWLSFWLAEQEVRGSIPGFAVTISEIGYLK